jgi:hypothetical protein
MEIVSFLFADDIPVDIINVGMPQIDDDDFIDALQDLSLSPLPVTNVLYGDSFNCKALFTILVAYPRTRFN